MIGSVPLAVDEMQLAPAMISAAIQNRGHSFVYYDINLELWQQVNKNVEEYTESVESLTNIKNSELNTVTQTWINDIVYRLSNVDVFLVNVFSELSQGCAYKIISRARKQYPNLTILVGGIGAHREIFAGINQYHTPWLDQHLPNYSEAAFGAVLLNNGLINDFQQDSSHSIIDKWFPLRPSMRPEELVDFKDHRVDQYDWPGNQQSIPFVGSYGCVRRCSFCDIIKSFPKYQFIEADPMIQQIINTVETTGISNLAFMDSLVNGSLSNFEQLLEKLVAAKESGALPKDFKWSGTYIARPPSPRLTRTHKLLKASGAHRLTIGVESGSDRVRWDMNKKFKTVDLLKELEVFNQYGIEATLLFFPGWPTETLDDFDQTLKIFELIQPYVFTGTVPVISMGPSGFLLSSGTSIWDDRDKIGLHAGPTPYLWRCDINPDLNFWESIRRRLLSSYRATMLGITLEWEAEIRMYVLRKLTQEYDIIKDYAGPIDRDILPKNIWEDTVTHAIRIEVNNYTPQLITINIGNLKFDLVHGLNTFEVEIPISHAAEHLLQISFKFPESHIPNIQQYDSGDYYASNGAYINHFSVDGRDITLNGFNNMFNETVHANLPVDYDENRNERAIISNTDLTTIKPANQTFHEHITRTMNPAMYREFDSLLEKIKCRLESLGIGNAE
jgi:tRNA A37 methylthiotransferase MiaB